MNERKAASLSYAAYSQGYQVQVMDDNGSIIDDYMAGNSQRCSQTSVEADKGLDLATLWKFAEQTAKEMADEREVDHAFVYRDDDAVEGLEASGKE